MSMGFSRQEYQSRLTVSYPRGFSQPRGQTCVSSVSLTWRWTTSTPWEACFSSGYLLMIPSLLFEGRECVLCIFVLPMNNPLIDVQQMKCIQPLNRHSLKISAIDDRTNATIVGHIYASSSLKFRKLGLPWWSSGRKLTLQCRRQRFNPWSGRIQHATKLLCL